MQQEDLSWLKEENKRRTKRKGPCQIRLTLDPLRAAPPHMALLPGEGLIKVVAFVSSIWLGNKSTSHQTTSHLSIRHRSTSHQSAVSQSLVNPSLNNQAHWSTSQPITGQPGTSQPGTSHQSFTSDYQSPVTVQYITSQSPVICSQVIVSQHSYPASIIIHVSTGINSRLPNKQNVGYEHSAVQELPNAATSSRQIIPLVLNFSQVSDPSVIVEPPNTYDQLANNASQT